MGAVEWELCCLLAIPANQAGVMPQHVMTTTKSRLAKPRF